MALLSWLSQTNPDLAKELGNALSPESTNNGEMEHSMMDMDVDGPAVDVPEVEVATPEAGLVTPVPGPLRKVDISVELPSLSLARRKEFVLVEDLDEYDDGDEVRSFVCLIPQAESRSERGVHGSAWTSALKFKTAGSKSTQGWHKEDMSNPQVEVPPP